MVDGDFTPRERELITEAVRQTREDLDRRYALVVRALSVVAAIMIVGMVAGWVSVTHEGATRVDEIQQSRFKLTKGNCEDTNERNRAALRALGDLNERVRRFSEANSLPDDAVHGLVEAVVPYRPDCVAYATQRVYRR